MSVEVLPAEQLQRHLRELARIYGAAFAAPPYRYGEYEVAGFPETLRQHAQRSGFKACVARDAGRIVGFTYGYTSARGQWWHDLVAAALTPAQIDRWLADCFELVELAVLPEAQGRGYGGRLHDLLLQDLPHRTTALSTAQEETTGQQLYQARGWQILVDGFRFPNRPHAYRIMGKALKPGEEAVG